MKIKLEEMKKEYELVKIDVCCVHSRTAKLGISEEMRKLKKKIDDEENRLTSVLKIKNIDGVNYGIPNSFGYYEADDRYTYEVKDGCLFRYENMKYDKDKIFHLHHYVWIPQAENKFVKLCVRTLGGDIYGERYYLSATYYKHPVDDYSYMEKGINTNNHGYKPYYLHVIEKMGLRQKKDNRKTNLLEWVNDKEMGADESK